MECYYLCLVLFSASPGELEPHLGLCAGGRSHSLSIGVLRFRNSFVCAFKHTCGCSVSDPRSSSTVTALSGGFRFFVVFLASLEQGLCKVKVKWHLTWTYCSLGLWCQLGDQRRVLITDYNCADQGQSSAIYQYNGVHT